MFFKRDDHLRSINHTNLVLIPKKRLPTSPKDYWPISLCNVIYKIISKVITNRLKKLLPKVIDESQSAFVQGKMINDNIMIAYESVHYMKKRVNGRVGYLACKLNMSKAYDRVEWDFLEGIMKKLGFARRWVNMVMSCVKSVTYTTVINGQ